MSVKPYGQTVDAGARNVQVDHDCPSSVFEMQQADTRLTGLVRRVSSALEHHRHGQAVTDTRSKICALARYACRRLLCTKVYVSSSLGCVATDPACMPYLLIVHLRGLAREGALNGDHQGFACASPLEGQASHVLVTGVTTEDWPGWPQLGVSDDLRSRTCG